MGFWTILSVWLRNTCLNQLVIVSFLCAILLLPRLLAFGSWWMGDPHVIIAAGDFEGRLIYVKASLLTHPEPADVVEYSLRGSDFPHQSTADQFFDESQFESYRELGIHIGEIAAATIESELRHVDAVEQR